MSARNPLARSTSRGRPAWTGAAFIVESMLLLVFVAASLAVLVQLFVGSATQAQRGEDLSRAVAVAGSVAEQFAHAPEGFTGPGEVDGLRVRCDVVDEQQPHGVLYRAVVDVYGPGAAQDGDEPIYSIETSRYVSEVVR